MGLFKQDRRGSGSSKEDKQMFQATCSSCGNSCEVPFKPSGGKPVLCNDCFRKNRQSDSRGGDRRGGRDSRGDKKMFRATCDSCGNSCEVPFRPTGGKPVYCDNCFGNKGGRSTDSRPNRGGGSNAAEHAEFKRQFEQLNSKLDKVLDALGAGPKTITITKPEKEEVEEKTETKKKTVTKKAATKKTEKKPAKKKTAAKKTIKAKKE